jgi:hypothetical protein
VWTYTHCYIPPTPEYLGSWWTRRFRVPSGERLTSLTGQFFFTAFYFCVLTWSVLNTFAWVFDTQFDASLYPKPNSTNSSTEAFAFPRLIPLFANETTNQTLSTPYPPLDVVFGDDWFTTFTYVNLLLVGAIVCFIEAVLLNQIKIPVVRVDGARMYWAAR